MNGQTLPGRECSAAGQPFVTFPDSPVMTAAVGPMQPPSPPPHLADYAHLAICENGATEAERDQVLARPRAIVLGVWERAPEAPDDDDDDVDDNAIWMGAPQGAGMFHWSAAPSDLPSDVEDVYIDWDQAPLAPRKRVRVRERVRSASPPPRPAEQKKRRGRPEQNLYNDHKAALRALDRQIRNGPNDAGRMKFIRGEVERRKRAADDYAGELSRFCSEQKVRCAQTRRRFVMGDYHVEFIALTTRVAKRHGLRHLDTGELLFA